MMRKTIARRLVEAKQTIPHFYLTIDCVIDDIVKVRKQLAEDGVKVSVNDFVIKASALALRKVPQANASWTDEAVRLYENVDVSVAVATDDSLIGTATEEWTATPMPLDARLRDEAALAEIELTSRVMIAASDYERHLTQREVDEILGVVAR